MFCHGLHAQGSCSAARSGITPHPSISPRACGREDLLRHASLLRLRGRACPGPRSGGRGGRPSLVPARPFPVARPRSPLPASPRKRGEGKLPRHRIRHPEAVSVPILHFRSSIPFRSIPFRSSRRRLACGGTLFRAYRVCAPASARARAGARILRRRAYRAPDCARTSKRRAHVSRQFLRGIFAPARNRKRSGPGMPLASSCPILARIFRKQAYVGNYFKILVNILLSPAAQPKRQGPGRYRLHPRRILHSRISGTACIDDRNGIPVITVCQLSAEGVL